MALAINTVWEVQPTAGSDNNGGGFVSNGTGTDWTQQTSPQYALTGLASAGSGNVVLSAAASVDMVGNIAQVISGTNFTVGFYQILSVVAGVSITFGTNNAAGSICSGVGASGVINIGGALATISAAYAAAFTSNIVWVKDTGTYTATAALSLTKINGAGGASSPVVPANGVTGGNPFLFIGYTSTRGDGGKVTWTTATNSIALVISGGSNATNYCFTNFAFTTSASSKGPCFDGGVTGQLFILRISNCTIDGFQIGIRGGYASGVNFNIAYIFLDGVIIRNCVSHGMTTSGCTITSSLIHANGGNGIHWTQVQSGANSTCPITLVNSVVYNNTGHNIFFAETSGPTTNDYSWLHLTNCAIVGAGGHGIKFLNDGFDTMFSLYIVNTIIYGNTLYGIYTGSNDFALYYARNNAYGGNGSGNFHDFNQHNFFISSPGDVALSADPFTNASGLDFSLNATSGGGAACKAAGFPVSIP